MFWYLDNALHGNESTKHGFYVGFYNSQASEWEKFSFFKNNNETSFAPTRFAQNEVCNGERQANMLRVFKTKGINSCEEREEKVFSLNYSEEGGRKTSA